MVTDYFFVYSYFFQCVRKKIEKNFWDMEIIGNRRKRSFVCFFAFHSKQNKFVPSFFGRIYGAPILLLVSSDLYLLTKLIHELLYHSSLLLSPLAEWINSSWFLRWSDLRRPTKKSKSSMAESFLDIIYSKQGVTAFQIKPL